MIVVSDAQIDAAAAWAAERSELNRPNGYDFATTKAYYLERIRGSLSRSPDGRIEVLLSFRHGGIWQLDFTTEPFTVWAVPSKGWQPPNCATLSDPRLQAIRAERQRIEAEAVRWSDDAREDGPVRAMGALVDELLAEVGRLRAGAQGERLSL